MAWALIDTANFAIREGSYSLVILRTVARKMACSCFYVLRDQVPFQAAQAFG